MFKVIEAFSGIGAQAKALERIGQKYDIVNTCDWDISAIIAYYLIHNKNKKGLAEYDIVSDLEIDDYLKSKTLSLDGKKPINETSLSRISADVKRLLYVAIKETNNLVSITDVKGEDIPEDIDLLTYSFPCQDLSACSYWHGNKSGISRSANNRSGMLWEVERILMEMKEVGKNLPRFLVMENVTNILSAMYKNDFNDWMHTLDSLGYYNKIYCLNAKDFGVPQKRKRAYMISILSNNDASLFMELSRYFNDNNLENSKVADRYKSRAFKLKDVLKVDYTDERYKLEADASQPNDTPSREKIFNDNDILFADNVINEICVNTITTKQDRNPNSGLIMYNNDYPGKAKWRYLTPRECFLLMGFDENDYDSLINCNPEYMQGKYLLTNDKLLKLAGNSICVDVLEAIFRQIMEINSSVLNRV